MNAAESSDIRRKPKNQVLSDEDQALCNGDALLLEHIAAHQFDKALEMLNNKQKINVADENGFSTAHAVMKASIEAIANKKMTADACVKFLLELVKKGCFVDYSDKDGKRPLNLAMDGSEHGEMLVQTLLDLRDQAGERVIELTKTRPNDGHNLLHDAAWSGNTEAMRMLLDTKAFTKEIIEQPNKQGQRVLHVAAFRAPKACVKLLTEHGADHQAVERNSRRLSRDTAEVMAERMGRRDSAEFLSSLGVTLNAVKFASKIKKPGSKADEDASPIELASATGK